MAGGARWGLDTCSCIIEYTDGDRPVETGKFLNKCNIHADDTLLTVIEENRGKNRAMAKLIEAGIDYTQVEVEFLKKGRGRRLCILTCPSGSPMVEIDKVDKDNTRILFSRK